MSVKRVTDVTYPGVVYGTLSALKRMLPRMNTPQFDWVKNRMPREPQPVPPIYAPETAADAIVWAATHRRRELSVGAPTAIAIWGNKVASGLFDRYLAKIGYDAQQTDQPADPARPHNLWTPLPGDHGTHGRFTARTTDASPQTGANEHLAMLLGLAVGTFVTWRGWRRS